MTEIGYLCWSDDDGPHRAVHIVRDDGSAAVFIDGREDRRYPPGAWQTAPAHAPCGSWGGRHLWPLRDRLTRRSGGGRDE